MHLLCCYNVVNIKVAEVMLTLKQAFQSAFQQNTSKNLIVCELCPLHQFHKFCQFVDSKLSVCVFFFYPVLVFKVLRLSLKPG